jgi:hypothetical protein
MVENIEFDPAVGVALVVPPAPTVTVYGVPRLISNVDVNKPPAPPPPDVSEALPPPPAITR